MATHPQKIKRLREFALGNLSPELAEQVGGKIPWDGPGDFRGWLVNQIESGRLTCRSIKRNGVIVGGIIYEVENGELVLTALAGLNEYDGLTSEVDALAADLAREVGATSIRLHTQRAIVAENALDAGFVVSEVILRKKV